MNLYFAHEICWIIVCKINMPLLSLTELIQLFSYVFIIVSATSSQVYAYIAFVFFFCLMIVIYVLLSRFKHLNRRKVIFFALLVILQIVEEKIDAPTQRLFFNKIKLYFFASCISIHKQSLMLYIILHITLTFTLLVFSNFLMNPQKNEINFTFKHISSISMCINAWNILDMRHSKDKGKNLKTPTEIMNIFAFLSHVMNASFWS